MSRPSGRGSSKWNIRAGKLVYRSCSGANDGPWRQAEVLQDPRVQLRNGLDAPRKTRPRCRRRDSSLTHRFIGCRSARAGGELRRNNSGANKRPQSEVEQFLAPAGVTLLRPATSRSVRRRRGIPVWKNSTKRAPGPMTARGDRVRCSRDPGSNYRTGSSAPRKARPRCRRRGRSVVSCGAGRQGPVGNYRETTPPRTRPLVLSTYATLVGNGG